MMSVGTGLPNTAPERTRRDGRWMLVDEGLQPMPGLDFYLSSVNKTRITVDGSLMSLKDVPSGSVIRLNVEKVCLGCFWLWRLSGGAEGVETAIKLARQIHLAADRPQKIRLISRWKSYHGLTLGALSAMGRTAFRASYAPLLSDAVHIFPPYCLRCSYGLRFPECRLRCALALEETILNLGPETVSAFIAETVSGGTLAAYPPPEGYFSVIREICDRYDVLLILDEVMQGFSDCSIPRSLSLRDRYDKFLLGLFYSIPANRVGCRAKYIIPVGIIG